MKLFQAIVNAIGLVGVTVGHHGNLIEEYITKLGDTYDNTNYTNKGITYSGALKTSKEGLLAVA